MTRSVSHIRIVVVVRRVVVGDGFAAISFHGFKQRFAVEYIETTPSVLVVGMVKLRQLAKAVDLAGVVGDGNVLPIHLDDEVHSPPFGKVLLG